MVEVRLEAQVRRPTLGLQQKGHLAGSAAQACIAARKPLQGVCRQPLQTLRRHRRQERLHNVRRGAPCPVSKQGDQCCLTRLNHSARATSSMPPVAPDTPAAPPLAAASRRRGAARPVPSMQANVYDTKLRYVYINQCRLLAASCARRSGGTASSSALVATRPGSNPRKTNRYLKSIPRPGLPVAPADLAAPPPAAPSQRLPPRSVP